MGDGKVALLSIQTVTDLDGLLAWVEAVHARGYTPPADAAEAALFSDSVRALRSNLSPNGHPSVQAALAAQAAGDTSVDFRAVLLAVPRAAEFKRVFEHMQLILGEVRHTLHGDADRAGAQSRRDLNATRRSDQELFTAHAGKVALPPGAARDVHGNAADDAFLLGRDGACTGLKALFLSLFDYRQDRLFSTWHTSVVGMLRQKGLQVDVISRSYVGDSEVQGTPTAAQLAAALGNANQLWLISGHIRTLTVAHVEVIKSAWRNGLGLYIAGDNDPYNADANLLLAALGMPTMSGNYGGRTVLTVENGNLVPHLLTTGLRGGLYSGVTVADFPDVLVTPAMTKTCCAAGDGSGADGSGCGSAAAAPFDTDEYGDEVITTVLPVKKVAYTGEVRKGHQCVGIVVFEGSRQTGRIVADGAFTRLYCDWHKHGTPQFVGNAACYLAAGGGSNGSSPAGASAATGAGAGAGAGTSGRASTATLDYRGAKGFECAISHEDTAGAGFIMLYGDVPYDLVKDADLNDPVNTGLALGPIVSVQALQGDDLAAFVRENNCPFTRRNVLATIPLVSLAVPSNVAIVGFILTGALTDGRFTRAAWLMFFGVCVAAMQRSTLDADQCPYRWLVDQMLAHVTMSASFTAEGPFVPLGQAINVYARPSTTDPFSNLRKSLTTILQGLCPFVVERALVGPWVRRKRLLEAFYREVAAMAAVQPRTLQAYRMMCNAQNFQCHFDTIPIAGRALVPCAATAMDAWCRQVARIVLAAQATLMSTKVETFVAAELQHVSLVRQVWTHPGADDAEVAAEVDLRAQLEAPLQRLHCATMTLIPPFATVYGPSVLVAPDGTRFYSGRLTDVTPEAVEAIAARRRAYLNATFGANNPTTASNYPLHVVTRSVMHQAQFAQDEDEVKEAHVRAVAQKLERRNKGNIHTADFAEVVHFAVQSFLEARRQNRVLAEPIPELPGRLPLVVLLKAEIAVKKATGAWLDL